MVRNDDALVELLHQLVDRQYHFTCVTPATHGRVLSRPAPDEPGLRDIFGWNRHFLAAQLEPELLRLLERSGCVEKNGDQLRSRVRVASLGGRLFLHSSYPTSSDDSVFLGPDTYRFVRFVLAQRQELERAAWLVDMGAGSGAGGILAGAAAAIARVTLVDINPAAARLARINAIAAGAEASVLVSDQIPRGCDLVIANPPYMMDISHRTYRDGGAMFGGELASRWAKEALESLGPAGTMLLYTGAAVRRGRLPLVECLQNLCTKADATLDVEEIDPDVFGEELENPAYGEIERIAALGIRITKRN
ncbi:methyltransferase [Sphingomonas agri]|uniref:methyltransferase n=1 Tax=Sphingomonas agri TaxID=1813878 RepID=UPI00311DF649